MQHPEGVLVVWIDLAEQRPFTLEDQTLLTVLAGRLGQGLQRVYQVDQQRETALGAATRNPRPCSTTARICGALPGREPALAGGR